MIASSRPISLAVVDDNDLIGLSLQRWLAGQTRYVFAGWFSSPEDALGGLRQARSDVLLVDVEMPGFDAFDLVGRVATEFPSTVTVMLSGHSDRESIERSLRTGAAGYIVKDEGVPEIMALIDRAVAGEVALSQTARVALGR